MAKLLSNADIAAVCDMRSCIAALHEGIAAMARRDAVRRPRIDLLAPAEGPGEYSCFSTMDGLIRGKYYALRIKPDIISWPVIDGRRRRVTYCMEPGLYGGLVLLFSAKDARLLAIMNDGYVQHMRVGALAGIGARYLARPDASVVGMIGSGGMARSYLEAFCAERPIERVKAFSPNRANLDRFCAEMAAELSIRVEPQASAEAAVRDTHIVATCTNASEPVLRGEWIAAGAHIANVTPWEVDRSTMERIDVVGYLLDRPRLDVRGYRDDAFEVRQSVICYVAGQTEERAGIPTEDRVHQLAFSRARWGACVDWESGTTVSRPRDNEVTILAELALMAMPEGERIRSNLASDGIQGLQFAAVAGCAYELAEAAKLGIELPQTHFLQDIPT